jgi:hypothetical protein
LIALLMTAQAFSGDRAAGTESFLLERPVSRTRIWLARTLASFGSTWLVLAVSFLIWLAVAAPTVASSSEKWSTTLQMLLWGGSLASLACLMGGMLAASLLSAPLAALLLGVVLVMVPIFLASTLAEWFAAATIGDVPVGLLVPVLVIIAYPLGSWIATCRGEPAGRGRIFRGTTTIVAALLVAGLVFLVVAPTSVRVLAKRLEHGADIAASSAGTTAVIAPSRDSRGAWLVELASGKRLRFLPPPLWHATWSRDGQRVAVITMAGPLGSAKPTVRVEFYDLRGRSAGRTLHYDSRTWIDDVHWAGDLVVLRDFDASDKHYVRVYDPRTGESRVSEATPDLRIAGFVGPTPDGRLFVSTWDAAAEDDPEPGVPYSLYPVDLDTAEIGDQPVVQDAGRPWWKDEALSPSGRYWLVDRRSRSDDVRPVLDLETGEELDSGVVVQRARWLTGDVLFWIETEGSESRLVTAEPGGAPEVLRSWSDLRVSLQPSPDRDRLLVTVSEILDSQQGVLTEQQIVQTWVFDPADDSWTELTTWPDHPYKGYAYGTTWAGPRTVAITGPRVLVFESLDRPGEIVSVIGSLQD